MTHPALSGLAFSGAAPTRRGFLLAGLGLAGLGLLAGPRRLLAQDVNALNLQTVLGLVPGSAIEGVVAHEHLFVDFYGPNDPHYMNVNWSAAIGASINKALELRAQGVNLMIEWTNIGVGRNIFLLRDVAVQTGLNIVCPTGIYKSLLPPEFVGMSAETIAERFYDELTKGIDGTAVRAGFIKIATTEAGPTATDSLIHQAAAIAGREAGATIALHSPLFPATAQVIATLQGANFPLERFVWGHAQPSSIEDHKAVAALGATIQYDAISAHSDPFFNGPIDDASMLERIAAMVAAGYGGQVIVSADASVFVNPQQWQYDRSANYVHGYFAAQLEQKLGAEAAKKVLRDNVIHAFRAPDKAM